MTHPKLFPHEFVYVMANPINEYTRNSGFPSVISWRAMDDMKIM